MKQKPRKVGGGGQSACFSVRWSRRSVSGINLFDLLVYSSPIADCDLWPVAPSLDSDATLFLSVWSECACSAERECVIEGDIHPSCTHSFLSGHLHTAQVRYSFRLECTQFCVSFFFSTELKITWKIQRCRIFYCLYQKKNVKLDRHELVD